MLEEQYVIVWIKSLNSTDQKQKQELYHFTQQSMTENQYEAYLPANTLVLPFHSLNQSA